MEKCILEKNDFWNFTMTLEPPANMDSQFDLELNQLCMLAGGSKVYWTISKNSSPLILFTFFSQSIFTEKYFSEGIRNWHGLGCIGNFLSYIILTVTIFYLESGSLGVMGYFHLKGIE